MSGHSVDPRATQLNRRSFFRGLGLVVAAPAIIKVSSLMGMPRAPVEMYGIGPAENVLAEFYRMHQQYLYRALNPPVVVDDTGKIVGFLPPSMPSITLQQALARAA